MIVPATTALTRRVSPSPLQREIHHDSVLAPVTNRGEHPESIPDSTYETLKQDRSPAAHSSGRRCGSSTTSRRNGACYLIFVSCGKQLSAHRCHAKRREGKSDVPRGREENTFKPKLRTDITVSLHSLIYRTLQSRIPCHEDRYPSNFRIQHKHSAVRQLFDLTIPTLSLRVRS